MEIRNQNNLTLTSVSILSWSNRIRTSLRWTSMLRILRKTKKPLKRKLKDVLENWSNLKNVWRGWSVLSRLTRKNMKDWKQRWRNFIQFTLKSSETWTISSTNWMFSIRKKRSLNRKKKKSFRKLKNRCNSKSLRYYVGIRI